MIDPAKPLPRITPDTQPFWDALRLRRFELPFCADCGKPHLPAGPVCPFCFCDRLEWRTASGRGTISTWTVVHKAWFPAFAREVPYNVVQVELDEGPRLTASVVGIANERLAVGLPVVVDFDDVSPEVTLPRFRPTEGRAP
ncbi:MAG TPA: OB-fold domain-containing protein [Burkholderiales bacterium]|nr:OB-fold domain-containing protein [Burkholderiales bacterium]